MTPIFTNQIIKYYPMIEQNQAKSSSKDVQKETAELTQLHRYFNHFKLNPNDFSIKGNKIYDDEGRVETRGGWPYFKPVKCKRYGLNVLKKYDNGSEKWLGKDGNDGQWAVAYHGIKMPENVYSNNLTVFASIMAGLNRGQMLTHGPSQEPNESPCLNLPNQKLGIGIYMSPHIQTSLAYTGQGVTVQGKCYFVVLQCRVNPKKIKMLSDEIWVVNQSKDVRPYGVILVKKEEKENYPGPSQIYQGKHFDWNTYKDKIK